MVLERLRPPQLLLTSFNAKGLESFRLQPLPRHYAVVSFQQRNSMSSYPVHRSLPPTRGTVPTPFRFPNVPSTKPVKQIPAPMRTPALPNPGPQGCPRPCYMTV